MKKIKRLLDEYRFPGFRPLAVIKGKFGDNKARIVKQVRLQKKRFAAYAVRLTGVSMTEKPDWSGICPAAMLESILKSKCDESIV
ncbi:hypothetical protein A2482_02035 [Candidatus Falkowbacteria bacterium RIFOXYC2_FULL_48_21]|uniref:Uncharacterized protein n=1 Tax=Candidatus Falkowbacteria bacterium RIFOXYC2_FULL_48_21 TaxID=1798005 RepID=A0A1F5T7B9_9BACT|nr:MAG: hypothetical protein A2482_02035 [Candidatus Falkowbacteria bacterium RIFOXYC2_FULL_48_21]